MTNNDLHPYVCFHEILISKNSKQNWVSVQTWRVKILRFFVVNVFDVFVHVPFQTELFLTELALIGLESLVYDVDVLVEVSCQSKLLPTLTALIGLESPVYGVDVSLEVICPPTLLSALIALVALQFLMNLLDVPIKFMF